MSSVIEGVDYIFNRYAYLKLDNEASIDSIKVAIRKARAENHPDKLQRVSQDIQDLAKRNVEYIDQCERVLLNEQIKPLYDEKLKSFIEATPYLVSESGVALFDPSRFKIDVDYLMKEEIFDFSDLEAKAMHMSGYKERNVLKSKKNFEEEPTNENKEDYRIELTNKFVYLNLLEDFYWSKAGISGLRTEQNTHTMQSSKDIFEVLEKQIEFVSEQTQEAVQNRNGIALLGFSEPLLLTYKEEVSDSNKNTQLLSQIKKSFELKVEDLKKLIEQKKETLDELVKVSEVIQTTVCSNKIYDVVLVTLEDGAWPIDSYQTLNIGLRLDVTDMENVSITSFQPSQTLTKQEVNNWDNNLYLLCPNNEIKAPILEAMSLLQSIVDKE